MHYVPYACRKLAGALLPPALEERILSSLVEVSLPGKVTLTNLGAATYIVERTRNKSKSATNLGKVPLRAGFPYKDENRSRKRAVTTKKFVSKFLQLSFLSLPYFSLIS